MDRHATYFAVSFHTPAQLLLTFRPTFETSGHPSCIWEIWSKSSCQAGLTIPQSCSIPISSISCNLGVQTYSSMHSERQMVHGIRDQIQVTSFKVCHYTRQDQTRIGNTIHGFYLPKWFNMPLGWDDWWIARLQHAQLLIHHRNWNLIRHAWRRIGGCLQ